MSEQNGKTHVADVGAPYSQEAEEAVLGACLIDPAQFINLRAFLKPKDFFLLRHGYIWEAMMTLDDVGDPIDMITLPDTLKNMGKLDDVGGLVYLVGLLNNTGTSVYAEVYGRLVERTAIKRKLMATADDIKRLAMDESTNAQELKNYAQAKVLEIELGGDSDGFTSITDAASVHIDEIEWRSKNPNAMIGIETGYTLFDHVTRGLQDSRFYLLAARPGMGKSAFMGNIALHAAHQGKRVAWFTYEMTEHELVTRFTSQLADVDNQVIESGMMERDERTRYVKAVGDVGNLPIEIAESNATPMMIRSMCRKLKYTKGLDIVFIDYAQLIPPDIGSSSRVEDMTSISRALKQMAMELRVPVVAAAQLNRKPDERADHRPVLSDLRESGSLEQDADLVAFVYSNYYYDNDLKANDFWESEIIIAKQRNGGSGHRCKLGFRKSRTQFVNLDTHSTMDLE